MADVTRTLVYHGDAARIGARAQMLREADVQVEYEPPPEERDLAGMAQEVVVNVVSTGTLVAIAAAVKRFRARFPRHRVDADPDVNELAADEPDDAGFLP